MRHLSGVILLCAAALLPCASAWAGDYDGTWQFNLKVARTTCDGVAVGDKLNFDLEIEKTGRLMEANPTTVGVGQPYVGYTHSDGYSMALQSSCVIAPEGACSPRSESWIFERPENGKKNKGTIVWISIQRNSENEFVCSSTYTGTARKKRLPR